MQDLKRQSINLNHAIATMGNGSISILSDLNLYLIILLLGIILISLIILIG